MITFRIIAEAGGWYVSTGAARSGPCLSHALAVERAQGMVDALRAHGEQACLESGQDQVAAVDDWSNETRALAS